MAEKPEAPLVVAIDTVLVSIHATRAAVGGVVNEHEVNTIQGLVMKTNLCAIEVCVDLWDTDL